MNKILIIFFILYLFIGNTVSASLEDDFQNRLLIWEDNISEARNYLRKAEKLFKDGNYNQACKSQKKASNYGVIATNSLIKAFVLNDDSEDIKYLEIALEKWKNIGSLCK